MKILLTFLAMITFTVIANLLLKIGASPGVPGQGQFYHLLNWRVLLGLVSFGLAACSYLMILQWLPLNVAISFAAAQYVAVILASAWILNESIRIGQWGGIALITAGIIVVGWAQR